MVKRGAGVMKSPFPCSNAYARDINRVLTAHAREKYGDEFARQIWLSYNDIRYSSPGFFSITHYRKCVLSLNAYTAWPSFFGDAAVQQRMYRGPNEPKGLKYRERM
jgi:hypothetical protein